MPFPIDNKYIIETELELNVKFPTEFKSLMKKSNGGEIFTDKFEFNMYPFFDKSDKKKISRTYNHIELETKNAQEWGNYPENGIAIGSDGLGNQVTLMHDGNGILNKEVYLWNHETGKIQEIAESINNLYS